ncbi:HET-domain-containing protein, partial [Lindgomyces ingoldianus]
MKALDRGPGEEEHSISPARIVNQERVDYSLVKSWMRTCLHGHSRCSEGFRNHVVGMKVIDCVQECLVMHKPEHNYIALSYVWGPPPKDKQDQSTSSGNMFEDSPRVIRDAIHVTRELGYRYLWIDRYCINQTDGEEKMSQLTQMDLIYENADMTIVAGAGEDDRHGLPGAGSEPLLPRCTQPAARIGDITVVSTLPEISHFLGKSRWATRGWTYQEAVLSRRCLMFFPTHVFFVCRTMCRSE